MNTIDIKDIEVKFDEYGDASCITFQNKDGERCGYLDLGDDAGFMTEDEAFEIEGGDWYDRFDDIYGEDEKAWEAEADRKLETIGVKLGEYHDDGEYYELEAI